MTTFVKLHSLPSRERQAEMFSELDARDRAGNADGDPVLLALSFENATNQGVRRFASAEATRFIDEYYFDVLATERCFYEIIREGSPCRLYLDLECVLDDPSEVKREREELDRLVDVILLHLAKTLWEVLDVFVSRRDFLELDASSPTKFSRHLILHLPGDVCEAYRPFDKKTGTRNKTTTMLFSDNSHVGVIVQRAVTRMTEHGEHKAASLVDTAVYTRNRAFRMYASCKYTNQQRVLGLASETNSFVPTDEDTREGVRRLVRDSLVCPLGAGRRAREEVASRIVLLSVPDEMRTTSFVNTVISHPSSKRHRAPQDSSSSCSPFPHLDEEIRALGSSHGGPFAEIRCVTHAFPPSLTYYMARNRYCGNVQRQHKSNNVVYHLDLAAMTAVQTCLDPDCGGYRSPAVQLRASPPHDAEVRLREWSNSY